MKDMKVPTGFAGAAGNRLVADEHQPRGGSRGTPVVLLHGGGQTRHAWGGAARRIADSGHTAFTVDQRGHGESAWVDSKAYAFDDYAADAAALCHEVLGRCGRPPVLVGASLGGISGLMAEHMDGPGLLAGLVLVDITPHMDPDGVSRIQGFMAERMREGFATLEEAAAAIAAYLPHRRQPRSLEGLAKNLRRGRDGRYRWHWDPAFIDGPRNINTGAETVQQRLAEAARALSIPVLLVRGQQSELVTEEAVGAFREMAPHARFVDVSGAGHMVAGDRNDAFNDAVLEFLDQLGG
ncbi:MAG: alpha/beta hydrolase [Hoeflea sp.]|uniref:alpha/beta fold hydrolase n=1 Tax=Hoeflea sp. TaxID=1940281 RepID=UPI0032EE575F